MAEALRSQKSDCKNCYRCIRHCPVKSIRFSAGQASIVEEECILCGSCYVECPQNAKSIRESTESVRVMLQSGRPVYASLAPSYVANYEGAGITAMRRVLMELGFAGVEETAVGATIVKREYDAIVERGEQRIVISSCCHSVNLLIAKYFPALLRFSADILSPMQAHAAEIKKRVPDARVVFVGPCIAKKDEADRYGDLVDEVLTFDELDRWLESEGIRLGREEDFVEESKARLFPVTGGILKTMECRNPEYSYLAIDGVENCIAALRDIEEGNIDRCFIEMSACVGSCIGGPVMNRKKRMPVRDYLYTVSYAGKKDFDVADMTPEQLRKGMQPIRRETDRPSEQEIRETLARMGKVKPEHELNCGTCGYSTCRNKAIAVIQGKADITMCLPFYKEKAESMSATIMRSSPNAILVLNERLEIQQINGAALELMNIRSGSDVLGEHVVRILDPEGFYRVLETGETIKNKKLFLTEYRKSVSMTISYDAEYKSVFCLMRDITEEEEQRGRKEQIRRETIETTDKVVEKQMRIVQEIAMLLGETTAETKIALTKLKESISDE